MLDLPERPKKRLGQNFLVNEHIAEIEAVHGSGKNVLEIGAGLGTLTRQLCKVAKRIVSVEIDTSLYDRLKGELGNEPNLKLINKDFFKATDEELELSKIDIVIANVPYKLSSRTIKFLIDHNLQAVLCLQKEFVEHMLAKPGSGKYSRLSVMSQLSFRLTKIMDVSKGNFWPVPNVDSAIIYLKPIRAIGSNEADMINSLMQYKKKTLRVAIIDALENYGVEKAKAFEIADAFAKETNERVFKLEPEALLDIAVKLVEASKGYWREK